MPVRPLLGPRALAVPAACVLPPRAAACPAPRSGPPGTGPSRLRAVPLSSSLLGRCGFSPPSHPSVSAACPGHGLRCPGQVAGLGLGGSGTRSLARLRPGPGRLGLLQLLRLVSSSPRQGVAGPPGAEPCRSSGLQSASFVLPGSPGPGQPGVKPGPTLFSRGSSCKPASLSCLFAVFHLNYP